MIPLCADQEVGILSYSPLGAGFLTGKYREGAELPAGARFERLPGHQPLYFTPTGWRILEGLRATAARVSLDMAHLALAWTIRQPGITCVLIGARSVDTEEARLMRASGVRIFTMREIDERGMGSVMDEAVILASRNTVGFHVTMDMDFVDPAHAPGVGTPVPGGPTYRECHLAMEKVADSGRMLSFELTEVNPVLDISNRTAELGVELILSAFGKKIM